MTREKPGLQMNTSKVQINPNDLEDVVCDKCGSQCFEPTFLFKRLSAVLSPTGQETMVPLQIYRCADCGHINDIFMPKEKPGLDSE
jgi:DNA-directed RNA polymerase subunit RPC12/RpoP